MPFFPRPIYLLTQKLTSVPFRLILILEAVGIWERVRTCFRTQCIVFLILWFKQIRERRGHKNPRPYSVFKKAPGIAARDALDLLFQVLELSYSEGELLNSNSSMQIVFQYKDVLMSEYLPE
jgi:hypothetical protein